MLEPSPTPKAARRRALIIFLLGCVVSGIVVVLVQGALKATETRDAQKINTPKIDRTEETLRVVEQLARDIDSCTDPQGACAKRGQRNTAKAVDSIALRQVAAVACADRPGTQRVTEIQACVERVLRVIATTERHAPRRS